MDLIDREQLMNYIRSKKINIGKLAHDVIMKQPNIQKQEPCEDAISRQAVLEQTYNWSKDEFLRVTNPFDYLRKRINSLPSVKPQEPKTGRWEWVQYDNNPNIGNWHCSKCNRIVSGAITAVNPIYSYKYCPQCGARMERGDKECLD